ncbi:hypothetical protein INT45_001710, partial [Circinella minor]
HDIDFHFDISQQQQSNIFITSSCESTMKNITPICGETTSKNTTLTYHYDNDTTKIYGSSVKEGIKRYLDNTPLLLNTNPDESSFYVGDLGVLHRQHLKWQALLPRIEPFYAIKCNPDTAAIKYLASLGVGFDCASKTEIQQVLDVGVKPSQIVYAQPVKPTSFIQYAAQMNVALMTFDNQEELYKIKKIFPEARLVLRILVDDSHSAIPLGTKYGAPLHTTEELLQLARILNLNVVGVSFHVGSECSNANAYYHAVVHARHVFDQAEKIGFQFELLDVGGGFNDSGIVDGAATFEKVAAVLAPAVDELFPSKNINRRYTKISIRVSNFIILASSNTCYLFHVFTTQNYLDYINDGFYGSFSMPCLDKTKLSLKVLRKNGVYYFGNSLDGERKYLSVIWGPTCCSLDRIEEQLLPELNIGDWLYLENFGAYTITGASTFNGFDKAKIIHVNSYLS